MQEFASLITQTSKPRLPFLWPASLNLSNLNPIPQKYRPSRRMRLKAKAESASAPEDITALKTSFNPIDSIRALRRRRWSLYDLQYLVLFCYILFAMTITPHAPLLKSVVWAALALLVLMPISQQFLLPSLPIWTYLFFFFSSRYIDVEYRPHIWVKVLPALENVLYGASLSNILSSHTHPVFDLLAWVPYGLGHFGLPAICSLIMFLFAAPGTTPMFARCLGYIGMIGVSIQILLPCTAPWYEKMYGLMPAHYGMAGSPAGLARVDELLGFDMYTTGFTTAPVPFGAFPSLHAADAVIEALFMQYCFPRFRPLFIFYVGWMLWATMYLNHHYAVDLVGGGIMAVIAYYIVRPRWLPRPQSDKRTRWQYEYVEYGDRPKLADEEYGRGYGRANGYGLGLLERRGTGDSDEWTVGSSSSFDSSTRGGEGASGSGSGNTSPGSLSPSTPEGDFRHVVFGMTPQGDVWDGDRRAHESELSEVVVVR